MGRRYSGLYGWTAPCPLYPGPWTQGGWGGGWAGGGPVGLVGERERERDERLMIFMIVN